ncbi:MAG: hypothetical protein BIFFINMI_02581 [Phycisphaerae bacterium]|nr:hypothetical protein [Phycisphaerae bacterium]
MKIHDVGWDYLLMGAGIVLFLGWMFFYFGPVR